jgi:hypothetical protein
MQAKAGEAVVSSRLPSLASGVDEAARPPEAAAAVSFLVDPSLARIMLVPLPLWLMMT